LGANDNVEAIAVQMDGKILVGGSFTTMNGTNRNHIARLNPDGTLDSAFDPGDGPNGGILAIASQPGGKVLMGGYFSAINGTNRNHVARLNPDGTLDSSFNPGEGPNDAVFAIVMQTNGTVLVGGAFTAIDGTNRSGIARLRTDGSLDASFDPGTGIGGSVFSVGLQQDGRVVVVGYFSSINGTNWNAIGRLNADGGLDYTFNPGTGAGGTWDPPVVRSVAIQSDGKIVVGGDFSSINGAASYNVARLNSDGGLDPGFANQGAGHYVSSVVVQPEGKVIVGGSWTSTFGTDWLVRLNVDGTVDGGFEACAGVNGSIRSIALQTDGKMLIGGEFVSINGVTRIGVARLNGNGTLDTTFDPRRQLDNTVLCVASQPDGKALVGGWFAAYNGASRSYIARLNPDGIVDSAFNSTVSYGVNCIAQQTDGKILVGGYGGGAGHINRLNADGSVDQTFHPGADNQVLSIALQSDGKVLLGGWFTSINGTNRNRIARLNPDGTLDLTFNPAAGADSSVFSIAVQADGRPLIAGYFTNFNGVSRRGIARLNTDGSLDQTFDPGTGALLGISSIALQGDGKVLLGGNFTTFDGVSRSGIARLNVDGTLDKTFNPGTGADGPVWCVAAENDGKMVVGGTFLSINGIARGYLGALLGGPPFDLRGQMLAGQLVLSWANVDWSLQSAPLVNGTYTNLPGASSPYTNVIVGSQQYFRLKSN
jgi:uncharacterized delta-60 repeat protein